jgi:hypothetical protein
LAAAAFGANADYLPLAEGNSWTYRASGRIGRGVETIRVSGAERIGEQVYYLLTAFGRESLPVRYDGGSTLLVYDRESQTDRVWMNFAAAAGESFETAIHECVKTARIEKRDASVSTPIGTFEQALHVTFVPSCADAGLTQAYFVEGVGLVKYEMTTIAGPVTYELIEARTGDSERSSGITSRLTLDAPVYPVPRGEPVDFVATFAIRNSTLKPVRLEFRSGQRFDLAIYGEGGQTAYVWSADKLFPMVLGEESLGPGGERRWTISAPLPKLAPGHYMAEAWLTPIQGPPKAYSASVGFDVAEVIIQPEE